METTLEQFISSDKPKRLTKIIKDGGMVLLILGFFSLLSLSLVIGLFMLIIATVILLVNFYSYVDFEYELYDGNIDISKIYSCKKRKIVQKILKEDVERVYETSKKDIGKNEAHVFFNTNIKNFKIYTFELQNSKKVQLALNEKMEGIIKIMYRSKITY